ncbi:MAG TPA: discoidin domain-containing protein, partial [Kiritimatiellia bacterium]
MVPLAVTVFSAAAQAATVTASTTEGGMGPGLAMDGDTTTRWSSTWTNGQWWLADFGTAQEIRKLVLQWETAYAKSYDVSLSEDGTTWTKIFSETNGNGAADTISIEPRNARAIRIDLRERGTQWGFSLFEVQVNPAGPVRATAKASTGDGDYAPAFAIDGDMTSRWASGFGDEEWWQAEFEQPRNLAGVKLSWETAYGEKYLVQVSMNGHDWKTVYKVDEGDGRTDLLYFGPVEAKAVRIKGIQRGTGWGYSLFEVEFIDAARGPAASADDARDGNPAGLILDGDVRTEWHSAGDGANAARITLSARQQIGGIELAWGDDFAAAY